MDPGVDRTRGRRVLSPLMREDRRLEQIVLLQDLALLLVSLWIAHDLRLRQAAWLPGLRPAVPLRQYVYLLLIFVPSWALAAYRFGLQSSAVLTGSLLELARAILWTQVSAGVAIAVLLTASQTPMNRSLIALFLVLSTLLLTVAKLMQRSWIRRQRGKAVALVLGTEGAEAAGELARLRGRSTERLQATGTAELQQRLRDGGVDEVVIADDLPAERLHALLGACDEIGVPTLVRVGRLDLALRPPRAEFVGTSLYLAYERHEPDRPGLLLKAVIDRTLAGVGLVATFPLLAVLALLVRQTSPGPAFFVQRRGGRYGRPFPMFKFRTMRVGAESERDALLVHNEMDGPVFKIANDPRVTGLGRFLRRTSLDELPQLLNVLAGQMSLVGPRPLPLTETRELAGAHRRRLSMRPGLTCLWQVSGRNALPFDEWMALDLQYIDQWSLGLDLAILFRTMPALLLARGAR